MGNSQEKFYQDKWHESQEKNQQLAEQHAEQQRADQARAAAENKRLRDESTAKLEMKQKEAHKAEQIAQNERLEREKIARNLKQERAASEAKAETSKLLLEQQQRMSELQLAMQKEQICHAEEAAKHLQTEKQRMKEDFRETVREMQTKMQKVKTNMEKLKEETSAENANLQLKLEKQKGESKNQLTKKEEEIRQSRFEMSQLQHKMDSEKTFYNQNIVKKDKEISKAKDKAKQLRVEQKKTEEDLARKIQEQVDYRVQEQKEARKEQNDLFLMWRNDNEKHLALHMQRELEFRQELGVRNNQALEFMLKAQNQALEYQANQFKMLALGMPGLPGGGFMGPAITDMKFLDPTHDEKQLLVMRNPCVVMIDNFEKEEPLHDVVKNDENMLRILFEHFEADVRPILNDQCLRISTRRYGRQDYSANDGIIVFLFSHGNNMTLQDRNKNIQIEEVLQIFEDNRSLDGKPKLFCVQAMRRKGEEINETSQLPKKTDFLVCYCEMTEETYIQSADDQAGSAFTDCMRNAVVNEQTYNIKRILEIIQHTITARIDDVIFGIQSGLNVPVQLTFA